MIRKERLHRELHMQFDEVKLIMKNGEEKFKCKSEVYKKGVVLEYDEVIREMCFYNKNPYTVLQLYSKVFELTFIDEEEEEIQLENELYEIINYNLSLRKELSNSFYIER